MKTGFQTVHFCGVKVTQPPVTGGRSGFNSPQKLSGKPLVQTHMHAYTHKPIIDNLLLLLIRQMEIPVSPTKVAVHRRSLRLPYSLRATGVWSGQIPFLSGS